ncbi:MULTISPECIES: hypothetical protein [unclassified Streptomyces]|uniref:hypothetical protein n=1 Tax=unclassified Streptomyces TaxID=2593676 RepID=UPI0022B71A1A|nr:MULTISPECIES: hypothetical protein [unclassified Streptomyces]MCZ7413966.1 hypothetical protein [Streptomyces sp. WMMC897]MCZ7430962.1 hypothetical protein [Streptomyces sp. WMMC1477]
MSAPTVGHSAPPATDIARRRWQELSETERDELLGKLQEQVVVPRPLQFFVGELSVDNDGAVELIADCRRAPVAEWTDESLILVSTLWLWQISKVAVSELNQADLSFSLLQEFFLTKRRGYRRILAEPDPGLAPGETLFDLAASLVALRKRIERDRIRCMRINGATWERREWFLPKADIRADELPEGLQRHLEARTGHRLPPGDGHVERFTAFTEQVMDSGTNPAEILVALAEYALTLPELGADYSIITCARGNKLETPHDIAMSDVMSYTAVRQDFDPAARGVRLKHDQIMNAISQRMRYNVVCRVRNYSPDPAQRIQAQAFQHPDIAVMEDAHHNGHRANGVRFVTRAPLVFDVDLPGGTRRLKGLADFRINRATHDDDGQFTPKELAVVIRISWWMKAVTEATWRRGLWFDEKYCVKLDSYEDKDGGKLARRKAILGEGR